METAVIAALVAAAVSLVGSLINLRIAREARKTSHENARLAAVIRAGESKAKALKSQNRNAEKLRVATWWLQSAVSWRQTERDSKLFDVDEAAKSFRDSFREFFDHWADAKDEIDDDISLALARELRHDCKNHALDVLEEYEKFESAQGDSRQENFEKLRERLEILRRDLDDLFNLISDVRTAEMRKTLFNDDEPDSTAQLQRVLPASVSS